MRVLLMAGLFGMPVMCQATNNCPWINEATASGLLDGEVTGAFTDASTGQPAICTFLQKVAGLSRTLRVTVEVVPDAHARLQPEALACSGPAAPLPSIGNEAVVCAVDLRKEGFGKRVVARVRDQVFTITLSTTLKDDPVLTQAAIRERIYTAAEQVAGNLF
jgi:hypothetical protein